MATVLDSFTGIRDLGAALSARKLSAVELARQLLSDIEANRTLNAFVDVQHDLTLEQACAADKRLTEGQAGLLTGMPLAHKDIFVTQGWRTTAGSKMLQNYVSPFDATVVQALSQAGTVCLGKVSCDEFAMGSGNEHCMFGPVQNPWDPQVVPGGSSGGSAAAVAAGLAIVATGTDTGGSVRQPAALCGISGIKPTYGMVSRYGMIAYASSLDQAGMLGRSADDLALTLDAISGFDEKDATSIQKCLGEDNKPGRMLTEYETRLAQADDHLPLHGLRVGVPREYFEEGLDAGVAKAVLEAIEQLVRLGATRVDISLPNTRLCIPAYYVIAPAEASSNLARYDAVRYGHRTAQGYKDIEQMQARSRTEGFGQEVRKRIMVGTYVLSHGYYDAYYLQAQKLRRMIADDFNRALTEQCDVILGPVSPTVAPPIGSTNSDPTAEWLGDIYTLGVNLAGLPAMSVPCGFAKGHRGQDLPVGLQLIGRYFDEARLLSIASQFQKHTDWHARRPGVQP